MPLRAAGYGDAPVAGAGTIVRCRISGPRRVEDTTSASAVIGQPALFGCLGQVPLDLFGSASPRSPTPAPPLPGSLAPRPLLPWFLSGSFVGASARRPLAPLRASCSCRIGGGGSVRPRVGRGARRAASPGSVVGWRIEGSSGCLLWSARVCVLVALTVVTVRRTADGHAIDAASRGHDQSHPRLSRGNEGGAGFVRLRAAGWVGGRFLSAMGAFHVKPAVTSRRPRARCVHC